MSSQVQVNERHLTKKRKVLYLFETESKNIRIYPFSPLMSLILKENCARIIGKRKRQCPPCLWLLNNLFLPWVVTGGKWNIFHLGLQPSYGDNQESNLRLCFYKVSQSAIGKTNHKTSLHFFQCCWFFSEIVCCCLILQEWLGCAHNSIQKYLWRKRGPSDHV